MCNNNGHCRKFDAGTMCPSYRVTRDEQHLTRGRANTLRLALSGQLGADFASHAVRDALDLCVSCKGCRRECPTGVDMAKMKIEFLHHWQRAHGLRAARSALIAHPAALGAVGGARAVARQPARRAARRSRAVGERWLGLSARRSLPRWRRDTFLRDARRATATPTPTSCCSSTRSPTTSSRRTRTRRSRCCEAAATASPSRVPRADDAEPARPLCCGRTFLAAGLVDEAKREARRMVAALAPHVARGAPVVGLEPSCLLVAARRVPGDGAGRRRAAPRRARAADRGIPRARAARPGGCGLPLAALPRKARAAARPLPPEGVRRDARRR